MGASGGDLKEVIFEQQCEGQRYHSCHDPQEGHLGSCDSECKGPEWEMRLALPRRREEEASVAGKW